MPVVSLQAELESVNAAFEEADSKVTILSKQCGALEGQLADSQEILQEETRQKLSAQSRVRQLEEAMEAAQDQLEEEEEARKALENKIAHLNSSVSDAFWLCCHCSK